MRVYTALPPPKEEVCRVALFRVMRAKNLSCGKGIAKLKLLAPKLEEHTNAYASSLEAIHSATVLLHPTLLSSTKA
jgi:hypothetical protein